MQKIQYDRGGNLIWSYQNTIDAYSKKVTGFTKVDQTGGGSVAASGTGSRSSSLGEVNWR